MTVQLHNSHQSTPQVTNDHQCTTDIIELRSIFLGFLLLNTSWLATNSSSISRRYSDSI
ncbi:unnamed protein product [Brassica napus]|uniref:(rape) hypothetical protein n=1 Tax=Brassica napus TaxID=3708 RepID=A0A816MM74_BRANA|nr:unnamed protein product [Brassica napus]